jgi:hypothetical protein
MNSKNIGRIVTGAALGLVVMLGVTLATAQAQYRNYDDRGGYDDQARWSKERTKDYAFKLGYHEAYSEARDARERGFRGSYRDMPGYHNDTNGYLAWMGHRDDYRDAYRKGYESAFKDVWSGRERRYGRDDVERVLGGRLKDTNDDDRYYDDRENRNYDDRYDKGDRRDYDWRDGQGDAYRVAEQNGYRDGYRHGEEDRSHHRGFNYEHSDRYRDALSGYRSEYGSRDRYRNAYRDGYQRGYSEGFGRGDNSRGRWPF